MSDDTRPPIEALEGATISEVWRSEDVLILVTNVGSFSFVAYPAYWGEEAYIQFQGTPLRPEELTRVTPPDATATVVPAEYFDQLVARLDAPPKPSPALREAFRDADAIEVPDA